MQIFEVTQPSILGTIGQDIKSAVTDPFKKASAVMSTPGALTSASGYGAAIDSVERDAAQKNLALAQQYKSNLVAQQTQQRAQQLTQAWLQLVKSKQPRPRLKSAPTPIKPTGQYSTKPTASTTIDMDTGRPVEPPAQIKEQISGTPTPAELAQYQKRVAAASAPKTGFKSLPGSKPDVGGTVDPRVTAQPKTILTGSRAKEFETWADQQLTSKIPGTNVVLTVQQIKQKYPAVRQALNTAMTRIIRGNNDPKAVEEYLTTAMQAMQQYSAELKQSQPRSIAQPMSSGDNPLGRVISDRQLQDIKTMAQNPVAARAIKAALGIR